MEKFWPFILPLALALVGFAMLWPLSVRRKDASIVDLLWGPGFFAQLAIAAGIVGLSGARDWVLLGLIGLWSLRLGFVIARRAGAHPGEDPRYRILRRAWGAAFWWKSLFVVFLLQAFVQWVIVIGPVAGLAFGAGPLGAMGWFGLVVACVGLGIEALADAQLDRFKRMAGNGALCTTGLRAHVRHPNYLGEMIFWTGIGLVVLDGGVLLGLLSPLVVGFFLVFVSGVPMLDEHLSVSRDGYSAYRERVPALLPRLRK